MPDFTNHFITQWFKDVDCFLGVHDRKICVLGICTLISLPQKPQVLLELAPKIMPALIVLFEGLKKAYAARAQDSGEEEESESDDDDVEEVLSSDEDDIDEKGQEYLDSLSRRALSSGAAAGVPITATIEDIDDASDDLDSDYNADEMALESYTTVLDNEDCEVDEYIVFKEIMSRLETTEGEWYKALTSSLEEEEKKALMEISVLADQKRAAKESKRIEQQGGKLY